jgi:hypothetical protein
VPKDHGLARANIAGAALASMSGCWHLFAVQHSVIGASGLQAMVDAHHSRVCRAVNLRVVFFAGVDPAVLAGGQPNGRRRIWRVSSPTAVKFLVRPVCLRLAAAAVRDLLINHFDLFGLRQVLVAAHRPAITPPCLRHPVAVSPGAASACTSAGFTIVWAAPTMTVAHLVFAAMCTAYILFASSSRNTTSSWRIPSTPNTADACRMLIPFRRKRPHTPDMMIGRNP